MKTCVVCGLAEEDAKDKPDIEWLRLMNPDVVQSKDENWVCSRPCHDKLYVRYFHNRAGVQGVIDPHRQQLRGLADLRKNVQTGKPFLQPNAKVVITEAAEPADPPTLPPEATS